LLGGIGLLVTGRRDTWSTRVAPVLGVGVALALDTRNSSVNALVLGHGIVAIIAYGYGASRFLTLSPSRRSAGTRTAAAALIALAVFWAFLTVFQLSARLGASSATAPWSIRVDRYSFFLDLALQLGLAYAMVRLLFEDGERENEDTRAQLKIRQDRDRMSGLVDETTGLLNRAAYDAHIGLEFAKASFGSVVRLRLTNDGTGEPGRVDGSRVAFFAAQLDSAVRTHDRIYRWSDLEFLVVMPRATPEVAESRMMFIITRAAPFAVAGARQSIRADAIVAVHAYSGGEDLGAAVDELARDPRLT
jgi:GGDEF domain-containing protein